VRVSLLYIPSFLRCLRDGNDFSSEAEKQAKVNLKFVLYVLHFKTWVCQRKRIIYDECVLCRPGRFI